MLQLVCEILLALVFVFVLYLLQRKLIGKIENFNENRNIENNEKTSRFGERSGKSHKNH